MSEKIATIFFIENVDECYIEADINGYKTVYGWYEQDIAVLRDRIESAGIESVTYSGINELKHEPMSIEQINELCVALAKMV